MIRRDWLCLSLTKTRGWEARDPAGDRIASYPDLVIWAVGEGAIPSESANPLLKEAEKRSEAATAALVRIQRLRSSTHGLLSAIGSGRQVAQTALSDLNSWLPRAHRGLRVVRSRGGGFGRDWTDKEDDLDRILWACVRSLADLLLAPELERLKFCHAHDCGWLFIDASRNRSRRWCDMGDCGNRAKVKRFRQTQRRSGGTGIRTGTSEGEQ